MEQLFEAAQGNSLLFAVVGFVYLGLVVVLAITAVFTSKTERHSTFCECCGFAGERSHVTTTAPVATVLPQAVLSVPRHSPATSVLAMIRRLAYEESRRLAADSDFYPLLLAAMRCADTGNEDKLRQVFPDVWEELRDRYQPPGGVIEGDPDFQEYLRWHAQTSAAAERDASARCQLEAGSLL